MNNNVLILAAGRRVELVQAFQSAMQKNPPLNGQVFAADLDPKLSAACHIADNSFALPRADDASFISELHKLCLKQNIGLVIPTIDHELLPLAKNQQLFSETNINVIISSEELVRACRDKRKTAILFNQIGIEHPKIYQRENIKFPCFCKPYDGSSSIGAFPIYSREMLTEDIIENEKNIFLELIDKSYSEYTVDCYYNKEGKLCCLVPRERIEVRAGEVSKGITRKNFAYEQLAISLSKLEGARGCVTVQVFVNPEKKSIKALEINPRFGGGYPLALAAGANYPEWLIKEYLLGDTIMNFHDQWKDNLLMLRYDAKVIVDENCS